MSETENDATNENDKWTWQMNTTNENDPWVTKSENQKNHWNNGHEGVPQRVRHGGRHKRLKRHIHSGSSIPQQTDLHIIGPKDTYGVRNGRPRGLGPLS